MPQQIDDTVLNQDTVMSYVTQRIEDFVRDSHNNLSVSYVQKYNVALTLGRPMWHQILPDGKKMSYHVCAFLSTHNTLLPVQNNSIDLRWGLVKEIVLYQEFIEVPSRLEQATQQWHTEFYFQGKYEFNYNQEVITLSFISSDFATVRRPVIYQRTRPHNKRTINVQEGDDLKETLDKVLAVLSVPFKLK